MTPQEYLALKKECEREIHSLEQKILDAYLLTHYAQIPENLRPMTPDDVKTGQVVWYPKYYDPEDDETVAWKVVEEVLHPHDDWKAFMCDGARYGLKDAFVESDDN